MKREMRINCAGFFDAIRKSEHGDKIICEPCDRPGCGKLYNTNDLIFDGQPHGVCKDDYLTGKWQIIREVEEEPTEKQRLIDECQKFIDYLKQLPYSEILP